MNQDKLSTSFEGKPRKGSHSKVELEVEGDKTKQHDHDVPIRDKNTNKQQTTTNILDFPDEILFCIFKNVDPNDLNNLRLCCTKFARLAADKFLWSFDYRKTPILPSQMEPYETFLKPLTYSLAIRGDFKHSYRNILLPNFFLKLRQICRRLRKLIIEQNYIVITKDTSTTLEKLEFKNCIVAGGTFGGVKLFPSPFFPGICRFVPYIKHLIFNNVLWDMESPFLTSICTLTELQKLEIISCFRIKYFYPDIDLFTTPCNCQKLEILNFQNTVVEDKIVEWFYQIESLKELYLECPEYLRKELSNESLKELQNFYYEEYMPMCLFDEELHTFLCKIEPLLAQNRGEEIIACRDNLFPNYLLSNISRYISRCTNLKILHIRHYSHVTRADINIMALTLPNLVELDITGCTVTLEDVKYFELQRPNVETYSSFSKPHKRYAKNV
ncbi:uncharacterized protein LOC109861280 [Pseudomyrmex gracilis]|uniref:uncharacterized protein LOC109861280 n=1 Tax=Pseudomyrmex gracilis TaxID=219809 RepID=UPI0009956964|nr:uncharacterized protein LOC109861280 [Pseudomyrmex gracilis]